MPSITPSTLLCRALLAVLLAGAVSGCACRPGHIGPYGGLHPARCWIW